jgi:putative RecB family exonuclease
MPDKKQDSTGEVRFIEVPVLVRRRVEQAPLKLSPSGIGAFRQCPRLYRFIYIDKLGEQYRKPRPYFTMANHVHDTLRDFLTRVPPEDRTAETIEKLLLKNWKRYRVGFRGKADELRWADKAMAQVRAFVAANDVSVTPYMVEASLESEVTPGLILRGRIDRVDRREDNSLHIIDYKTGNMPEHSDWTQLRLYALALCRNSPHPVRKLSYYYLGVGTIESVACGGEDLEVAQWDLLTTAARVLKEKRYRPRQGSWCRNCDFKAICPRGDATEEAADADNGQLDLLRELWDEAGAL